MSRVRIRAPHVLISFTYTLELADRFVEFESSSTFDGLIVGTGIDAMILVCRRLPLSGANGGTGSQFGLYASSIDSAFFSIIVAGIRALPAIDAFMFIFGVTVPPGVFITIVVAFGSFPIL